MNKQAKKFQTLTGEEVNYDDLTHNNMTAFSVIKPMEV